MTNIETRPPRHLTDDELSPWAVKRGEWNDATESAREGLILTYVAAAFVGGGLWLMIIHAVWAAFTTDPLLMEF